MKLYYLNFFEEDFGIFDSLEKAKQALEKNIRKEYYLTNIEYEMKYHKYTNTRYWNIGSKEPGKREENWDYYAPMVIQELDLNTHYSKYSKEE